MATPSFSQSVADFRTMTGGIIAQLDSLANVGITLPMLTL